MSHHGNDLAYDQRQELYEDIYNKFIAEHAALVELITQIDISKCNQDDYIEIVCSICSSMADVKAREAVERDIEKSEYIREEQEWDAREE
jgi:ketopantoate reductase